RTNHIDHFRLSGAERTQRSEEAFDAPIVELVLCCHDPPPLTRSIVGIQLGSEIPQMLTGVIEVYDLDGAREVSIPDVPYPNRTISHEDFEVGSIPAAAPSFGVEA